MFHTLRMYMAHVCICYIFLIHQWQICMHIFYSLLFQSNHKCIRDCFTKYLWYAYSEKETSYIWICIFIICLLVIRSVIFIWHNILYYIQLFAKTVIINEKLLTLFSTYIPMYLKITPRFLIWGLLNLEWIFSDINVFTW